MARSGKETDSHDAQVIDDRGKKMDGDEKGNDGWKVNKVGTIKPSVLCAFSS